jgi:hypothetical protein
MPITYTNRKGRTYYLCQGVTKTDKPRYFFAREPKGKPVEQIPQGYDIRESVNGVVSLAKVRPVEILPQEVAAVEAEVQRHPKTHNYQVDVRGDRIVVYERVGADPEELIPEMKRLGLMVPGRGARLREILDRRARFSPVLRFILANTVLDGQYRAKKRALLSWSDGAIWAVLSWTLSLSGQDKGGQYRVSMIGSLSGRWGQWDS